MIAMECDTAILVRRPWEEGPGKLPRQFVRRVETALRRAQDLERNRGRQLVFQQTLMRRGVVGLHEELVHLLELRGRLGQRKLIVKQAPLDIKMRLVRSVG